MELEEIDSIDRHKIEERYDKCGKMIETRGSGNKSPEYGLEIYIKCSCGNYVAFELPCN